MVTDPENKVYLFDLEKQLKPNKEVTIKAQRKETDKKRDDDDEISRSKSPKNKRNILGPLSIFFLFCCFILMKIKKLFFHS